MQLATFAPAQPSTEHPLAEELRQVVRDGDRFAARSLQVALGPSEIGEPCARRLAYRMLDHKRHNETSDPWAAIIGTAVHGWLADAFTAANGRLGRTRWLVEQRLDIAPGLSGSCDLFDVDKLAVIDHKVVGVEPLKKYRTAKSDPSVLGAYRPQIHLYGLGWSRLGIPVREVALAFYPRGGLLSGLHVWSEPYNEQLALDALERSYNVLAVADALGCDRAPENFRQLPKNPGHRCTYCPWFRPGPDTGDGCPGHLDQS